MNIKKLQRKYEKYKARQKEYPYHAKDIIGDSIFGDIGWAYNYLTHHWGELHPF